MKDFSLQPELLLRTPAYSLNNLWKKLSNMPDVGQMAADLREIFRDKQIQEAFQPPRDSLHFRTDLPGDIEILIWLQCVGVFPGEACFVKR